MDKHLYNNPSRKPNRRRLRKDATDAERKLWSILRNRQMAGLKFLRQYSIGPYILDFYCPEQRLAIEVDGGQHADTHGQQCDTRRDSYLSDLNIHVIRFWNNDVLQNIEAIAQKIGEQVSRRP
ncbi:MAG TPA: endonuclease domain-containing protein [Dehalococcoidia bacterium]|nr:endonuclease domain-containing protein [Dehalococcoidia bacterium]